MVGIQAPEDLQLLRRPIVVAGRCPLLPGIGYDINGTLDRINGLPLQGHFREAFAQNVDFIANKENATVVIPPTPNEHDSVNKLFGGIVSFEPEITARKNQEIQLGVGNNQQVAFYPQDCFIQLNGVVVAKDIDSSAYFKSLFPDGSEIIIHPDVGEGGKTSRGQSIFFYSSKEPLTKQIEEKLIQSTHRVPIRIPSPQEVGIDDLNRAVKMDHIDQMIGPDIIVADKNGKYVLIPIAEDYLAALTKQNVLPDKVQYNDKSLEVHYIPIKKGLLDMVDILNCPTSKQRIYIGPIIGKIVSLFIEEQEKVDVFQDELIAQILAFPEQIDKTQEATQKTKLTYQQLKFYELIKGRFESWGTEAQSVLGIHTQNVHILSVETPSTHYFKAGTKCKINVVS